MEQTIKKIEQRGEEDNQPKPKKNKKAIKKEINIQGLFQKQQN